MNALTLLAIFLVIWVAIGLVTGVWMIRRGHDALWVLIAVVLGPLFAPIALERVDRRGPRLAASGPHGVPPPRQGVSTGPRVLLGMDGSPESEQALTSTLRLLGPHCEVLVLAEVVVYEATEDSTRAEIDAASARLSSSAARAGSHDIPVRFEVLAGPPGETLCRFAEQQQMDLLIVGRRGRGSTTGLLGSVSAYVVAHSGVPVLVVEPSRAATPSSDRESTSAH